MSRDTRLKLIKKIERLRDSKVITYITGDRGGPYAAQIGDDVLTIFYRVLSNIGKTKKIDLFIYSRGGATEVPWKIVSLIREFCDEFGVLIPYRAHSAATMIAIGADEVVCTPAAELGPIDPSLTTPFNPRDPQGNPIPISVEAVRAYFEFASKLDEYNLQQIPQRAFEIISNAANPLAIGEIHRQHNYIRMVARKLLKSQKSPLHDELCDEIVKKLVEEMYYHGHAITRKEAKLIGLNVIEAPLKLEKAMWNLYSDYTIEMKLDKPFNPLSLIQASNYQSVIDTGVIAFIESARDSYYYEKKILLEPKRQQVPNLSMNLNLHLPPNIHQLIQQNPELSQLIQQILQQLAPQIQQRVLQELNRLSPIIGIDIKVLDSGWKKL